jgi:TPP-dependent 2-oxoacid decarboxylase
LATGNLSFATSNFSAQLIASNELNASYAADGYARVKEHSLGVVLTTFAHLSFARGNTS